jgi:PAS domain S-box-containing protein
MKNKTVNRDPAILETRLPSKSERAIVNGQEQADLLSAVLNSVEEGIIVLKPVYNKAREITDFIFCVLNEAARKMLPPDKKDIEPVGQKMTEIVPGIKAGGVFEMYVKVIRTGEDIKTDLHYTKDGFDNWYTLSVRPFKDGVIACFSDITSRKKIEQKQTENKELLKRAQRHSKVGNYHWDTVTGSVYFSDQMYELFGIAKKDQVPEQQELVACVHPDDREQYARFFDTLLKTGGEFTHEYRVIRNGEVAWLYGEGYIQLQDGKFLRTEGFLQDITARKVVEEKLKEQQDFVHRLTTMLPDIVYVYDMNLGRNVYSNRSTLDLLGYTDASEDMKENVYGKLAHPDDLAELGKVMQRLMKAEEGEVVQNEFRMLHSDGNYRWLFTRSITFKRDAQDKPIQIIGVLQDITERKMMEEELTERNEQLLEAQQLTRMGHWIFNTATGISHWSDQVYVLFDTERRPGESTFDVLERHVYPEDLAKIKQLAGDAIATGTPYQSQYRITRADGEFRMISTMAKPDKNKNGELVLKGICQDITERWMAEEKLRRSQALLEEAQSLAQLGSWEWDIAANSVTWTDELYRIYGYEPQSVDVSFKRYLEHIHAEDREMVLSAVSEELASPGPHTREYRVVRNDGSVRTLMSSSRTIFGDMGQPVRIMGICLDVTDKREAEKELQKKTIDIEAGKLLNKKKDEFISIASHELKTPLTSLKAYVQLLDKLYQTEPAANPQAQSFLSKAGLYICRLEGLISDLLDVSKIEAGKLQFQEEAFDFTSMLNESVENHSLTLARHKIILNNKATAFVMADRQRIDQVVTNLISNAVKYSPRADRVEVSAYSDDENVTVSVKDFGMGIAAPDLTRIFDRFYRVENAQHNITGLGLGLYIASEIIKRHHGSMWAESEPGKGSTFYFTLPVLK